MRRLSLVTPEQAQAASSSSATPSSLSPSRNGGGGGGGGGSGGGGAGDGVPAHQQEELHTNGGLAVVTDAALGDGGAPGQQQLLLQQAGEPIGNLMTHEVPYPNPLVWEEPALGEELRRYFGVSDYCGVL